MSSETRSRPALAPRLRAVFAAPRAGRAALIPYLTGGHPDLTTSHRLIDELVAAGADIVELGVPFSDPMADGPVVQRSTLTALRAGVTTDDVFALAAAHGEAVPFVLLTYLNSVLAYGAERFFERAAASAVEALVIPDLPLDEAARPWGDPARAAASGDPARAAASGDPAVLALSLTDLAAAHGVALVPMATPTSTEARLALVGGAATAFVYCVAVTGVTGARREVGADLPGLIGRLRAHTRAPLAVGFGISTPEQAARVAGLADGVIVGSALIDAVSRSESPAAACAAARELVGAMSAAIARG